MNQSEIDKKYYIAYFSDKCDKCFLFRSTVFDQTIEACFEDYPLEVGQWEGYCLRNHCVINPKRVLNTNPMCKDIWEAGIWLNLINLLKTLYVQGEKDFSSLRIEED